MDFIFFNIAAIGKKFYGKNNEFVESKEKLKILVAKLTYKLYYLSKELIKGRKSFHGRKKTN